MQEGSQTIAVVEDDDDYYDRMLPLLTPLVVTIERAKNYKDAKLIRQNTSGKVFWIIDGVFQMTPWRRLEELGGELVSYLEIRSEERGNKVGFTSNPKVFEGARIPIFNKEYFDESMERIKTLAMEYLNS